MTEQDILFEVDDKGVAMLTLNRPDKLNAITSRMIWEQLPAVFNRANSDDAIRALIITGAGRGFCSGADVAERLETRVSGELKNDRREIENEVGSWVMKLAEITKPVIAAVNGIAAGIGFSLTLLCDFRIASEEARFGAVFTRRALMPDGGMTFSLARIVGFPRALELMMTGDIIDAKEAERIGLVGKVVPKNMLAQEARGLAEKLAGGPPIALSFIKRAAYNGLTHNLKEQIQFESWGQNVCSGTEDFKEGVAAFQEKRTPHFRGR